MFVTKMTGLAGTSFFGRPSACIHRAGDPQENHYRDAITFTIDSSDNQIQNNWMEYVKPHHSENLDYNTQK